MSTSETGSAGPAVPAPSSSAPTLHQGVARTVRRQRRVWSSRVDSWSSHGSAGLEKVTAALIEEASVRPGQRVVDLGCGTGQISLPLAEQGGHVLAVDVSPAMVERLRKEAIARDLGDLEGMAEPIESLSLPPQSVDLIVTSYALHHLRDQDKSALVNNALQWLRPGGRLLIADMMFGRGATREDRVILASKVKTFARMGPGGWWRIVKNSGRFLFRIQERPISMEAWRNLLNQAGFEAVDAKTIVAEAGLVTGRRPAS